MNPARRVGKLDDMLSRRATPGKGPEIRNPDCDGTDCDFRARVQEGRLGENAPLPKKHGAVRANGVRKPPERKRIITQANSAG